MELRGKIFLQFLSSWSLMPFALLLAQLTGVAQQPEFITSVLMIASIVPIQIYLNEVFVPRAVRYRCGIGFAHAVEVFLGTLLLSCWLAWRLELSFGPFLLAVGFAQGYVWFSFFASRRILEYQADAVIGGRYSYVIGAIIPLTFLILVIVDWLVNVLGLDAGGLMYLLILLPNMFQYLFVRLCWGTGRDLANDIISSVEGSPKQRVWIGFFVLGMFMAMVAQYWKVALASSTADFAALSVYLIVPFSSAWLILSKSRYLTRGHSATITLLFWGAPFLVGLTLLLDPRQFVWIFLLALVTQVLTFKFITDTRARVSVT